MYFLFKRFYLVSVCNQRCWKTTDCIHPILKAFIEKVHKEDPFQTSAQKFITIALDGGLSIYHLNELDSKAADCIADEVQLPFSEASSIDVEVLHQSFPTSPRSFALNLYPKSGKANLIMFFWGWTTVEFFKYHQSCDNQPMGFDAPLDYTVFAKLGNEDFPILFIDICADRVEGAEEHNGLTKLSRAASISCHAIMKHLASNGRDPGEARCYGLLVGGTKAQCLIAHPVVTADGWYVQISIKTDWTIDVLSRSPDEAITIRNGNWTDCATNTLRSEIITIKKDKEVICQHQLKTRIDEIFLNEKPSNCQADPIDDSSITRALYQFGPSISGLQRLYVFFSVILQRMHKLENLPQELNVDYPHPVAPKKGVKIVRPVTLKPTSSDQSKTFAISKKHSSGEVRIYRNASRFSIRFIPLNYSTTVDTVAKLTHFEFERMEPLIDSNNKLPRFAINAPAQTRMLNGIKFALDTLAGLYVLNCQMLLLHADISPENIMFSVADGCWKLNDFDSVVRIDSAAQKEWVAGTSGFKAPEVEANGCHSPASDVFSLGAVFLKTIFRYLPVQFPSDSQLHSARQSFFQLSKEMTADDPEQRPSVKQAIAAILPVFKSLAPNYHDLVVLAAEEIVNVS